ncbi:MAG: hypothetical protein ACJAQZ_002435 [Planctomycetota bacterium]|jgi:hypothetical protein
MHQRPDFSLIMGQEYPEADPVVVAESAQRRSPAVMRTLDELCLRSQASCAARQVGTRSDYHAREISERRGSAATVDRPDGLGPRDRLIARDESRHRSVNSAETATNSLVIDESELFNSIPKRPRLYFRIGRRWTTIAGKVSRPNDAHPSHPRRSRCCHE